MKYDLSDTILISDMDGTLLPHHGEICEADLRAAAAYCAAGGHFAVATGRMPDMLQWAGRLGVNLPCVIGNGSIIYDYNTKKVLWERFLDPAIAEATPAVMAKFPSACVEMRVLDHLYVSRPNAWFDWHISWEKQKYALVSGDGMVYNCHKLLFVDDHGTLTAIQHYMQATWPGVFDYCFSCDVFLEIIPKGCTKGDAIPVLKRLCGMESAPVFALGDYGNDLTMLRAADFSGCPTTAIPEVRETVNWIGPPVGQGVLAEFIEVLRRDRFI